MHFISTNAVLGMAVALHHWGMSVSNWPACSCHQFAGLWVDHQGDQGLVHGGIGLEFRGDDW